MSIHTVVVGQMATNCYIYPASGKAIIVDPGDDAEYISDTLTGLGVTPLIIVATHGHFDHILAAYALQTMYHIPFAIHEYDVFLLAHMQSSAKHFLHLSSVDPPPTVDRILRGGDRIADLTVISVPGHSPGSICLSGDGILFTGDTIFAHGSVGRSDFSYSVPNDLAESVKAILRYPPATRLLPGHGDESFVRSERRLHKN